jgi:hypothetical protein
MLIAPDMIVPLPGDTIVTAEVCALADPHSMTRHIDVTAEQNPADFHNPRIVRPPQAHAQTHFR